MATVVAWNATSLNADAHPDDPSCSGSMTHKWFLRCDAAPDPQFSTDDTPFDPVGPGNNTNCALNMAIYSDGPVEGAKASSMEVTASVVGNMTILNAPYVKVGNEEEGAPPDGFLVVEERSVKVSINQDTGNITSIPYTGSSTDDDEGGNPLGKSSASLTVTEAFTVKAHLTHDFRNAYTGEVGVSAKFKEILGLEAKAAVDPNNLEDFTVTPTELSWSVFKIKEIYCDGVLVKTEGPFNIDE